MMTKSYSHYESLKVTPDAPAEVIRAAYRSLSQKHHPDKNIGNHDAAQMMMRLNAAYSVLSDAEQREVYDLQLLSEQRALEQRYAFHESSTGRNASAGQGASTGNKPAADIANGASGSKAESLLHLLRQLTKDWDGRMVATIVGSFSVLLISASWMIWKDNQSTLHIEQGMIYAAERTNSPDAEWPAAAKEQTNGASATKTSRVGVIQLSGPSGLGSELVDLPAPAASQKSTKAPAAASAPKATEYERLTAMLKSMGLGLHKLELPGLASNTKPSPAKAADTPRAAEAAKTNTTPSAREPAASSVAPSETSRVRDETIRPAAPDPVRSEAKAVAETSRASTPMVANANLASASTASANHAPPRTAVIAEARNCPPPPYPINAYRNGETGTVLLALLVGSDGRVVESKVQKSSGSPELDKAARKALSLCKFKPADGQTEPAWANLAYVWSID